MTERICIVCGLAYTPYESSNRRQTCYNKKCTHEFRRFCQKDAARRKKRHRDPDYKAIYEAIKEVVGDRLLQHTTPRPSFVTRALIHLLLIDKIGERPMIRRNVAALDDAMEDLGYIGDPLLYRWVNTNRGTGGHRAVIRAKYLRWRARYT